MALRSLSMKNLEWVLTTDLSSVRALSTLAGVPFTSSLSHRASLGPSVPPAALTCRSYPNISRVFQRQFHASYVQLSKDWYQVLGVPRDADAKIIKQAYFKMAKKYHPDSHPNDKNAKERFQEVSEAYDVLSDDDRRREFDLSTEFFNRTSSKTSGETL